MRKIVIVLSLIFGGKSIYGQIGRIGRDGVELARFDYTMIPSIGDIELKRTSIAFNFGAKVKKGLLGFGLGYDNSTLYFKSADAHNLHNNFTNLHTVRMNIVYRKPLKNNWAFNTVFAPMLSSNFAGSLTTEDFVFNSFTSFSKRWFKNELKSSLNIGLGFGTLFGSPRLFPLASYYSEINEKLSFSIGLPRTEVTYKLNDFNSINLNVKPEGLYANNSSDLVLEDGKIYENSKVVYNALKLSLGYNMKFEKNWVASFNLGYIPVSSVTILDNNDNDINDFNTDDSVFVNVGVSFNINKKSKKR